jgi:putative ABC transport system permease protein
MLSYRAESLRKGVDYVYGTILLKSFKMRKARYVLTVIALMIGASVGSALLMVSLDVEEKVATQLRDFGPNLIVVPETKDVGVDFGGIPMGNVGQTKYLSEEKAKLIRDLPLEVFGDKVRGILGKNAFIYSIVNISNEDVNSEIILAGTWFDQLQNINTWWDINGDYPQDGNSLVIGMTASKKLGLGIGDVVAVNYEEEVLNETGSYYYKQSKDFTITGIVSTGGDDDSRIFGDLDSVQNLTNKENRVNIMHISAVCNACPLADIAEIIEQNIDGIEVKTVKQIAKAEMETLDLIENLVGFITVVALGASGLAVMTTMSLSVVERRKEIGLMKAIGASKTRIALMFLGEGIIIAVIGGIFGFLLGILVAQGIGQFVFDSSIGVIWWVVALSIGVSLGIVFIASVIPIKRAMDVDPAIVLRGE